MTGVHFDERLHKFENKLLELFMDVSGSKRTNPKVTILTYKLLFHGPVTQEQIKELTGFSAGTVSNYLSLLEKFGYVDKSENPPYNYSFKGKLEDLFERGLGMFEKTAKKINRFLKRQLNKLDKLEEENRAGATQIKKRINETLDVFDTYGGLVQLLFKPRSTDLNGGE